MTESEIIHNVFVGDIQDAERWEGNKICVLEQYPAGYTKIDKSVLIPILREVYDKELIGEANAQPMIGNLELVSSVIQNHVVAGEKILVHCGAGMERSPLAVTWYLHRNAGVPLEDAFKYVKEKRPQAMNRLQWLDGWKKRHYKIAEESDKRFQTHTKNQEIDI